MKAITFPVAARIVGLITLTGSVFMIAGAVLLQVSGADLDLYLHQGNMTGYLEKAAESQRSLIINLTLWIAGVILIGAGATQMVRLSDDHLFMLHLATYNYTIAIPIVIVSYMAWMTMLVLLPSSSISNQATLAGIIGWFASRTDWIATFLVLGTGPVLIGAAGKGNWVPKWLNVWSYLALFAGILNLIALFADGLTTYGFLVIPVGMGWMFAVSIVLIRLGSART